jgi:hypothetical protein
MSNEKGLREVVERRLRQLTEDRDHLDVAIAELRRVLKSTGDVVIVAGRNPTPEPHPSSNGKPGLRATLCSTITAHPGISRDEAIDSIEASGFKPGGETPIRILVTSELYRLTKSGVIRKQGDGRYFMSTEEGED